MHCSFFHGLCKYNVERSEIWIGKLGLAPSQKKDKKNRKDTKPVFKTQMWILWMLSLPPLKQVEFLYSRHERVFMLLLFIQFLLEASWGDV